MYLTSLLLVGYLATVMIGIKKISSLSDSKTSFLSKKQTTILKGLCCIIVIFVHIPATYSNRLQDLVGSFAYIAVTLYFLLSAYGLRYSFENKKNYADNFLRNRVLPLIIPFMAIVIVKRLFGFDPFVGGLRFVYVLLLFYAITFICYGLNFSGKYLIYIGVALYSIGGYLTGFGFGWNVEALGFAYGFLLGGEKCMTRVRCIFEKYYIKVLMLAFLSSVIFGLMYLKYKTVYFWGEYLLRTVLGIALIILIFTVMYRIKLGNRINSLLGNISYEVYLIHGFVICILFLIGDLLNSGLFITLTVLISIMIAIPLHKINQYIANKIRR